MAGPVAFSGNIDDEQLHFLNDKLFDMHLWQLPMPDDFISINSLRVKHKK